MTEATIGLFLFFFQWPCLDTIRGLNALYQNFKDTSIRKLTLSFLPVQKQEGDFNCGSFAIVYAAEILSQPAQTSLRRSEDKTSSRRLEKDVVKTSDLRRLKTSNLRRLEDV